VINIQRSTPSPHPRSSEPSSQAPSDTDGEEYAQLPSGMRTPAPGPSGTSSSLETVQEVSQPNTPGPNLDMAIERLSQASGANEAASKSDPAIHKKNGGNSESGSDSGSVKLNTRRSSSVAPTPSLHSRQSSTALKFSKGHTTGETSSKHMTVEEEEVDSIPRVALGLNPAGPSVSASLKTKQSSETIRPKKEKKKTSRKQPPTGTGEPPLLSTNKPRPPKLRHCQSIRSVYSASNRSQGRLSGQGPYMEEIGMTSPQHAPGLSKRSPSVTVHMTNLLTGGLRPASSKADIFEAKVASAVEEADSSDSDETFVYDSNPPDVSDRPRRYHSRTPSATSMISQLDRNGLRSLHGLMDNSSVGPTPAVKRSMKFANTYISNGVDTFTVDEDGKGTGRSNAGSARGTGRHHHAGRWSRNSGGGSHLSLFDNESPFPNAARSKLSGSASRPSSNPPSPRFPPPPRSVPSNGNSKRQMAMVSRYDLDDTTTGADDERTPLLSINPNRSIRSTRSRRPRESRDLESSRAYRPGPSFLNRFASCLVLTVMLLLVITGAIGFMFATSQPLTHMELVKISNVLASEQELMMDITVRAHNPNIVVVSVDAADLEIFAKSPHAGTDSEWWRRPRGDEFEILDDPPNDPPPDMDKPSNHSAPNMRLGNVVNIDSPLNFEGSFFRAGNSMASAELRLARPGNDTDGGSERWERIIGDEFTLIVKGVLKYTLPLSQRIRSATVTAQTLVTPNSANDPTIRPPNGTHAEIGIS
jgi:hypothetical protein